MILKPLISASVSLCITLSGTSQAETLNILNWEEYLSPMIEEQWETNTGHTIESVYFDNDEKRDAILLNSTHHKIDIAVVDEIIAEHFGQEGRLIEITEEKVPNLKHLGSFWRERCGKHAVPYFWGTLGIVYRPEKVKTPPTSWQDLLQPSEDHKGHIGMMDDFTDMLAPALFFKGYSLNTGDPSELKEAFNVLKEQTKDVLTYEYVITYLSNSPKSDELHMALAYGGDQYVLNEQSNNPEQWKYVIPKEGTVLWVDCLAIPSSSENTEEALAFINYLSDPKVSAQHAEDMYYATPNDTALEYVSESYRNDSEVFPPQLIMKRSELYKTLSQENIEQRLRITNAVVNIHESRKAH